MPRRPERVPAPSLEGEGEQSDLPATCLSSDGAPLRSTWAETAHAPSGSGRVPRSLNAYIPCEPIRPASALDLTSCFAQLQREQKELKDVLVAWEVRLEEQLRAHRLALEHIVLEQTSAQARTLQSVAERLDGLMQQRALVRDGIAAEMELADRLEVSVLGLHLRHEQRLKDLEEGHSRWLSERQEQLLSETSACGQRSPVPRGRSVLSAPGATLLQTPRSTCKAPSASLSPTSPGDAAEVDQVHCRSGAWVSLEEASAPQSRRTTLDTNDVELDRKEMRVSFQPGPPSIATVSNAFDEEFISSARRASTSELVRPQGSFRSRSWPSSIQQTLQSMGTESEETVKFGSIGNPALVQHQRTAMNVIAELEHMASGHPEGSCWHSMLWSASRALRWWEGLREPERHGWLARIVRSRAFFAMSMLFILFDCVVAAYSSNYVMEHLTVDRTPTLIAMETCILVFYCMELFLKLLLHRAYFFLSEDWRWNVTDMIVVFNSAMVLSGLTRDVNLSFVRACRVFRIVRVFLLFRMVGFVKQLRVMMECVLNCFLNLFWCIVLVVFISYIFALILVQHLTQFLINESGVNEAEREALLENFGSVQRTLLTLFKVATGGDDWDYFYQMVVPTGGLGPPLFLFFVAFFTIAVWNIITSLFIEVAMSRVRPTTRELMIEKHHQDVLDVKELTDLFLTIDTDESNYISREEFLRFTENPEAMEALQVRGLDIKDRHAFFQMLTSIDSSDPRVGLEEFVDGCLRMRGPASSFDLHVVKFESMLMRRSILRALRSVVGRLDAVEKALTFASLKIVN